MALPNLGAHPRATDMGTTDQREVRSNERDYLLDGSNHGAVNIDVSAGGTIDPSTEERLANGLVRFTGSPSSDPVLNITETERFLEFENTTSQDITTTAADGELLLETGVDSLLLEDGSGVLLLEAPSVLIPANETRVLMKDGDVFREIGRVGLQVGALLHDGKVDVTGNFNWADFEIARPKFKDTALTKTASSSSSGTLVLDLSLGNVFDVTLTEDVTTLTISNPPSSSGSFTLFAKQDGTGGWIITWPASVSWGKFSDKLLLENGVESLLLEDGTGVLLLELASTEDQTLDPDAVDIYSFVTVDVGTTWDAFVLGLDMS